MRAFSTFWTLTLTATVTACASGGRLTPSAPAPLAPPAAASQDITRPAPLPAISADLRGFRSTPLSGEVFTAKEVIIKNSLCGEQILRAVSLGIIGRLVIRSTFSAHGNAEGPYPGTFVTKGKWVLWVAQYGGAPFGTFSQSFKITSGKRTIFGRIGSHKLGWLHCQKFAPAKMDRGFHYYFQINGIHYSGSASVRRIANGFLREKLR